MPHTHAWDTRSHPVTGEAYAACPCGETRSLVRHLREPLPSEVVDMREAHAEGLHDGDDAREFCPDCEQR